MGTRRWLLLLVSATYGMLCCALPLRGQGPDDEQFSVLRQRGGAVGAATASTATEPPVLDYGALSAHWPSEDSPARPHPDAWSIDQPALGLPAEEQDDEHGGWLRPLRRGHPDDVGRHIGKGFPLMGTSWLNRPWHAGWLVGELAGDDLISGSAAQDSGLIGGYRAGWDFDHYWGLESRVAFAHLDLSATQTARNFYLDGHMVYYPWGDARLRPFFTVGMGIADFEFSHEQAQINETLWHTPLGMGCKYLWKNWLALRIDLTDNLAWGSGALDTMHNVSFTAGAEARFGGRPRRYR